MEYIKLALLFIIISLASCGDQGDDTVSATTKTDSSTAAASADSSAPAVENKIMIPNTACYASYKGKDTITLKTERFPNVVTGLLRYSIYGKDSNKGDIDGVLHGDTLIADYKFMSEGKQSTRQVAFIIKDSTAIEGYGDVEEKEGKMVFKNTSSLKFGSGIKLKMIPCPEQ